MFIDLLQLKNLMSSKFNDDRSIRDLRVSFETDFRVSFMIIFNLKTLFLDFVIVKLLNELH